MIERLQIRQALPDDVHDVFRIVNDAYSPYVEQIGREPAPMSADYEELVASDRVWVALRDDQTIVGVVVLRPQPESLLLENVAVDPAEQGRGIGRVLIAFAEGQARYLGKPELTLYTNAAMGDNLRLYPALGFVEAGRTTDEGFERVFFRKPVS